MTQCHMRIIAGFFFNNILGTCRTARFYVLLAVTIQMRCLVRWEVFVKISPTVVKIEAGYRGQIRFVVLSKEGNEHVVRWVFIYHRVQSTRGAPTTPTLECYFLQTSPAISLVVRSETIFLNSMICRHSSHMTTSVLGIQLCAPAQIMGDNHYPAHASSVLRSSDTCYISFSAILPASAVSPEWVVQCSIGENDEYEEDFE